MKEKTLESNMTVLRKYLKETNYCLDFLDHLTVMLEMVVVQINISPDRHARYLNRGLLNLP